MAKDRDERIHEAINQKQQRIIKDAEMRFPSVVPILKRTETASGKPLWVRRY